MDHDETIKVAANSEDTPLNTAEDQQVETASATAEIVMDEQQKEEHSTSTASQSASLSTAIEQETPASTDVTEPTETSMAVDTEPPAEAQVSTSTAEVAQPQTPPPAQPYINSPSSWQIPPGVLQQKTVQRDTPAVQPYEPASVPSILSKVNRKRDQLEQRIKDDEEDLDAWYSLINDIQQSGDLDATRDIYERFLKLYPTSAKHWLAYLELELKYSNFSQVEALFTRCLKTVLSVDLWKFYLGYIRRINAGESGSGMVTSPEARAVIEKAYEYVLSNVGIDRDAGSIWADYIYFLKSAETTNTWEEQRKMDSMRRVYQKSVAIPLNNVEHLWKEYDQWENNLNRLTAKKFLGEKSSAYMTARTALRESRSLTENLIRNAVPKKPKWTAKEIEQLNLWKKYIQWEKGNPLHLEDKNAITERVAYVYQQAFLVLRFYPELWYDYAMYHWEQSKPEKTLSILKQGMDVLPTSLLLHFAYTEICESRKMSEEASNTFDLLLECLDKDIEKQRTSAQESIHDLQQQADQERASMNLGDDVDGELREQLRVRERQVKKEQDKIEEQASENVDVIMRQCSLVWIAYMRFARRTEGIKAARALFSRARKSQNRTYHIFIASALMEYHNSKDANIAGKIFGLGIKSFADDPAYICEYLDFLIQMNDDNNTRALFERSLATLPTEKATEVWKKFLEYENRYGDLASVQNVEKRLHEANPEVSRLDSFLSRYSYLDLQPVSDMEIAEEQVSTPLNAASPADAEMNATDDDYEQQHQQSFKDHLGTGRNGEPKRLLLESVHPERYPRPDWSQWHLFKPTAEAARPAPTGPLGSTAEELKRTAINPGSPPPPFVSSATPHTGMDSALNASAAKPLVSSPSTQQQQLSLQRPTLETSTITSTSLPDLITYFVTSLPSSSDYNGPVLNAGEFVELLRSINLPPLAPPPTSAPSVMRGPPMAPGLPPSGAPPPPSMGRGQIGTGMKMNAPLNRGRGRGGGSKRGGAPSRGRGMKRKGGRNDYEDDYQSHKGMGPNRPPDYDVFRARQAKRHRDDPPY